MIILFALIGVIAGWLIDVAGDFLFSLHAHQPRPIWRRPAILHPQVSIDLILELVSGGLFALLYALHGLSAQTFWLMGIYAFFALVTIMDVKYRLVLNLLTYPGLIAALALNVVLLHQPIAHVLLGVGFGFGVFAAAALVKPGGLGGGDVKLAALIGAALGFPNVLWALIVGALASAAAIVFLLAVRRRSPKDSIPYAPFLCLGAVVVFVLGSMFIL